MSSLFLLFKRNRGCTTMKSSLRSDEIQGVALDEIKSVLLQPCEAGFHRASDFIHLRWISPVEDGFNCVILRLEYHAKLLADFLLFFVCVKMPLIAL